MRDDNLYCFGGEDATLIYYLRCKKCGTIILENGADEACLSPWKCPICDPVDDFPFVFYTQKQLREDKVLGKLVGKKMTLFLKTYKEDKMKQAHINRYYTDEKDIIIDNLTKEWQMLTGFIREQKLSKKWKEYREKRMEYMRKCVKDSK